MKNKLTYDEWKEKNHIQLAPGVDEALARFHGIVAEHEMEQIRIKLYKDYLAEESSED